MTTNRDTDYRTSAEGTTSRDVDYHNRLEQEVTQLRQENANWKQMNVLLEAALKQAHADIAQLRLANEQLRQAIAVLNDEPTNSL